jgi:Kef-type K+ transport system membrane component KefB
MDLIEIEAPHGPVWVFLVVFVVLVIGPAIMERAKLPGLIGLLVGGYAIGPNGLDFVSSSNSTVPDLGTLGLLYLMFMAGVELDLSMLVRSKRPTAIFTVLTFGAPMALGFLAGQALDYGTAASLLLGSLFASHTLITYPIIRRHGLAGDQATAAAVGATVGCDTISLVVLAAVAGSVSGDASGGELLVQIAIGLVILVTACLYLLPRIGRLVFSTFGTEPAVRYTFAVAAFLAAGVLAEMVGIEHIVGAFFAGLALNRLVPNEGPLMHRVEFFGSSVFIPVFLVSVGLIMDPAVMIEPETIGLAALFCLACLGGKAIAAAIAKLVLGFTWPQAGVMYALTSPQAAATLAATMVGFELGLFGTRVVNAVLVVILVSVVLASALAPVISGKVARAEEIVPAGAHVLVVLHGDTPAGPLVKLAGRLAEPDGGRVSALIVVPTGERRPDDAELAVTASRLAAVGIDTQLLVRVDDSLDEGVVHTAHSEHATLLVLPAGACPPPDGLPTIVVGRTGADGIEAHGVPEPIGSRLAALGLATERVG